MNCIKEEVPRKEKLPLYTAMEVAYGAYLILESDFFEYSPEVILVVNWLSNIATCNQVITRIPLVSSSSAGSGNALVQRSARFSFDETWWIVKSFARKRSRV